MPVNPADDSPRWWAMSAVYGRSLQAKQRLEESGLEAFVPMRYVLRTAGGRKVRELLPAVNNLLFVRATADAVRAAKASMPWLHYLVRREAGRGVPIIVPDRQMRDFITLASHTEERLDYFAPDELHLEAGARVRVHGGPFDGVEGIFVRVQGARSRRVVVCLDGVMGIAAAVHPDYIEVLSAVPAGAAR